MQKTVIIIAGPTAIGKTALSIRLAQFFNTSIVSADSRQCYREMNIGTAKPSPEELSAVRHYFINSHSIQEEVNAAEYEKLALQYLEEIFLKNDIAVVCGGTGLYIKALCEGIDEMPDVDKEIEAEVKRNFEQKGIEWLQANLKEKDPEFFENAETQNPVRLIRALSFFEAHQQSISTFRKATSKKRPFNVIKIALDMPRDLLYERINQRVDQMMTEGLLQEVSDLYAFRNIKNLQTVGYSEFYDLGHMPLTEPEIANALSKVKQHTRNYAKRQLTWFRKDAQFHWFSPDQYPEILAHLQAVLNSI